MPQYGLTPKQQEMLCAIAPLLASGEIGAGWVFIHGDDRLMGIISSPRNGQFPPEWDDIDDSDIEAFIDCGLMKATKLESWGGPANVTVYTQKIVQACKNDFDDARIQPSIHVLAGRDVVGSNIGISSSFTNIHQVISEATRINEDEKVQLESVVRKLLDEVAKLDEGNPDREGIEETTNTIVEEVSKPKPNQHTIKGNLAALEEHGKNVLPVLAGFAALLSQFNTLIAAIQGHLH